jgi:hypothetical protein
MQAALRRESDPLFLLDTVAKVGLASRDTEFVAAVVDRVTKLLRQTKPNHVKTRSC